jgi:hypothetical protein
MEAAPVVTLIAVFLAIVVIAAFLITVTFQLHMVSSRLNKVLADVAAVGDKTTVLDPIIDEIAGDLTGANQGLDDAVGRLKERKGYTEDEAANGAVPAPHASSKAVQGRSASTPAGPPPTTFTNY